MEKNRIAVNGLRYRHQHIVEDSIADTFHAPDGRSAAVKPVTRGERIYYLPQNAREFWNVSTRAVDRNGLGFDIMQTEAELLKNRGSIYAN